MKPMRPHSARRAVFILAAACVALVGCGIDNALICGASCDPDARGDDGGGSVASDAAGVPVDGAQPAESGSSDGTHPDDSMTVTVDDGAAPIDSPVGDSTDGGGGTDGSGCAMCGLMTCCAPLQCATGTSNSACCSGLGGPCGGDMGSCCSGSGSSLVCTTAMSCATSCKSVGSSCVDDRDCCRGMSYCDTSGTKSCTACRPNNTGCSAHDECCSGHCSVTDGGTICGGGN
jgi:hypothetical protein